MHRDIPLNNNCLLHFTKANKFKVNLSPKSQHECPVSIRMMAHALIKSIIRLKLFIVSTFAVLAWLMRTNPVLTVLSNLDRKIFKNE